MKKLFCCYSVTLRDYLYQHGMKYELCAINPNSNTMFWAYLRTNKLDELLNAWSNGKR